MRAAMPLPLSSLAPVVVAVALALLLAAALHDIAFRTLPDGVSLALLLCGIALRIEAGQAREALVAFGLVLALALALWRAGWFGGGDAKLMPAATLMVPPWAVPELLLSVALLGGLLALPFLALRRQGPHRQPPRPAALPGRVLRAELWRLRRGGPLPYGAAIAAGAALALLAG